MTITLPIMFGPTPRVGKSSLKPQSRVLRLALLFLAAIVVTACSDDNDSSSSVTVTTRASGMTVSVQDAAGITVHTLTAPEAAFANSTHLIETENKLVAFDTQGFTGAIHRQSGLDLSRIVARHAIVG